MTLLALPASVIRGGSSRGVFIREQDIEGFDDVERAQLCRRLLGFGSPSQVDGLGGGISSTNKVMIVEQRAPGELGYRFVQLRAADGAIVPGGNCGNLASGVALFGLQQGWVTLNSSDVVRARDADTGVLVEIEGRWEAAQPGAPIPVRSKFMDPAGSQFGTLLPTGSPTDVVLLSDGRDLPVSVVDCSNAYVIVRWADLGIDSGAGVPALNDDATLVQTMGELCRLAASLISGGASDRLSRVAVVGEPDDEQVYPVRMFTAGRFHHGSPVTGAVCVATASGVDGTVMTRAGRDAAVLRHPGGELTVSVAWEDDELLWAGVSSTTRLIMSGTVFV